MGEGNEKNTTSHLPLYDAKPGLLPGVVILKPDLVQL